MASNLESELGFRGELEPSSKVTLQFSFYPQSIGGRIDAILGVQLAAENFFAPRGSNIRNILAIETPALPGINIPHFQEWLERTRGRYFDAYIQHTRTGFLRNRPFSAKDLANMRKEVEELVAANPKLISEADKEGLYFFGSLFMLERLAYARDFTLAIQPGTDKDFIKTYKDAKRLDQKFEKVEAKMESMPLNKVETQEDVRRLVEEGRQEANARYREFAEFERPRVTAFHAFIDGVIQESLAAKAPTRIFVPRQAILWTVDELAFNQRAGINYRTPIFIQEVDPLLQDEISVMTRFINDPNAEFSMAETVRRMLVSVIFEAMEQIGLERTTQREMPAFLQNTTDEELETLLLESLTMGDEMEGYAAILNFFGEKTTGETFGEAFKFTQTLHALMASDEGLTIRGELSKKAREALGDFERRQQG